MEYRANEFMTALARDYNDKIAGAFFCELPEGTVGRVHRDDEKDEYFILVDRSKAHCVKQQLFILYHEIGHVVMKHPEPANYIALRRGQSQSADRARERYVDNWAFNELGYLTPTGRIKRACRVCYTCCRLMALNCAKGIV